MLRQHVGAARGLFLVLLITTAVVGGSADGKHPFGSNTSTPSLTPTVAASKTPTDIGTRSPTDSSTITPDDTPTPTDSATITPDDTPTPTDIGTRSQTDSPTITPDDTPTPTDSATITPDDTPTPTDSATITPDDTPTPTDSATITPDATPTPTDTTTITPDDTPTPTDSATITPDDTPTPTDSATITPDETPTRTDSPTITPGATPTLTDSPTITPADTPTPSTSATITPDDTPTPTDSATITPDETRSATASGSGSASVGGNAIDPEKSTVCCEGPFIAGHRATCTINAVDNAGAPTGVETDECRFVLSPLEDGRGDAITNFRKPYYAALGTYKFDFVPYGSGCKGVAGVTYEGRIPLSYKMTFFKVQPNPVPNVTLATSECESVDGTTSNTICYITQRDTYNNPIKRCNVDPEGKVVCSHIQH